MKQRLITLVFVALVASMTLPTALAAPATHNTSVALTCFPHASGPVEFDNTWGATRSGGRGHTGTDLMSPRGLEVLAVADGYVETLRNGSKSGYYVRLSHDGGAWESWYLHLNNDTPGTDDGRGGPETAYAPGLAVGDSVKAGQVIGYVGDSGNAEWTAPHTHFELHIGGQKVNPHDYLTEVRQRVATTIEALGLAAASQEAGPQLADLDAVWAWLIDSGTDSCVSSGYKNLIEHLFGELPSERVLLAGMEAR